MIGVLKNKPPASCRIAHFRTEAEGGVSEWNLLQRGEKQFTDQPTWSSFRSEMT